MAAWCTGNHCALQLLTQDDARQVSASKIFVTVALSEVDFIPEVKMIRLFMVLDVISERARTAQFIAQCCDIKLRTVYRYLHLLNFVGFEVIKTGSYYRLGDGRPKWCTK